MAPPTRSESGDSASTDEGNPLGGHPYYESVRTLSRSTAGMLQLALDKRSNQHVVVKLLERGPGITRSLEREMLAHRQCHQHPNIVQLREVFLTYTHLAVVMEYMEGSDLSHYIEAKGALPEADARWLFQQLILAFDYYHRIGVKNRDTKLQNLMLTHDNERPTLKISDFEYTKTEQVNSDPKSALGTLAYTAPEALQHNFFEGTSADVWTCGVLLYCMLAGKFPFGTADDTDRHGVQTMISRITQVEYDVPAGVSREGQELLAAMMRPDPQKRATMAAILSHPWFLKDLPAGVVEANAQIKSPGSQLQSEEEIKKIAKDARVSLYWQASADIDDVADEVMDQDEMEELLDDLGIDGDFD